MDRDREDHDKLVAGLLSQRDALYAACEALSREAAAELARLDDGCAIGRYGLRGAIAQARAAMVTPGFPKAGE